MQYFFSFTLPLFQKKYIHVIDKWNQTFLKQIFWFWEKCTWVSRDKLNRPESQMTLYCSPGYAGTVWVQLSCGLWEKKLVI